jgi:hypothetical protein
VLYRFQRRAAAVCLAALVAAIIIQLSPTVLHAQQGIAGGGVLDLATSAGLRPQITASQIRNLLPSRGTFRFPAPYSTEGVRLTNETDCGGADCVQPVGYSYWSNINNHAGSDTMLIFLGLERRRGGGGPTLFSYNKQSGETRNLGPMFASDHPYSWSTGEGWYFSGTKPTTLYMNDGPRMLRYDVQTKATETVFDVRAQFGADKYIFQMHSSSDDRVHSATLRHSGTYEMLGCVAHSEQAGKTVFYPKKGEFDECQIDKSGRWLVIKENVDGLNGEDNRIIDLQTGSEQILLDPNGAGGHSDIGHGYMVAEDNYNRFPGAVRLWKFGMDMQGGQPASARGQGELVYQLASWSSGLGHVAHGNAKGGLAPEQQMSCASNASRENLPRVNEIVCFPLDGSLKVLAVAPNLTDLNAPGGGSEDYGKLPKGNLDVTGEYFIWTANAGTNRLDAFVVRVPREELLGPQSQPPATPSPAVSPTSTPSPSTPKGDGKTRGTATSAGTAKKRGGG